MSFSPDDFKNTPPVKTEKHHDNLENTYTKLEVELGAGFAKFKETLLSYNGEEIPPEVLAALENITENPADKPVDYFTELCAELKAFCKE